MRYFIALMIIVLVGACIQKIPEPKAADKETAIKACIEECEKRVKSTLADGPCLSNIAAEGWVCDVAHSPRIDADNIVENQCSGYLAGNIKHFVEVDPGCNLIRAQ